MPKYELVVRDEAKLEIKDHVDWLNGRKFGLGDAFLEELDEYLHYIKAYPLHYQKRYKSYRQAVLKKFPYVIIYIVKASDVIVFSVFATRMNPDEKPR
ncbi:type II toxin-antitoxin system RelE/ParE family toxin [Dokdonia sinensis]|uniref:Type II toxin-antitoxin system RelE/ParE family toxin n=1 Tax=Dokdonia sinensis TaxID=2479847 RepID=A0A3M0GER4_9FLAO|nr:type II toxin-antitoxin system RelE/ParE family toxin [Dokdonia sinensis]